MQKLKRNDTNAMPAQYAYEPDPTLSKVINKPKPLDVCLADGSIPEVIAPPAPVNDWRILLGTDTIEPFRGC